MNNPEPAQPFSSANKQLKDRTVVELTLTRLLSNLSDDAEPSPNMTLARHALGAAVNVAAESMMLLYFLEEPCMKALVLAASRIPLQDRKRLVSEIGATKGGAGAANRG
ncbi:hypothetical protein [Methylocystis echinoides]|uniref:hypothetical protein n=1 Tax=Methylocystis echinoides TaxID=29468 RepID=UPI00342572C1